MRKIEKELENKLSEVNKIVTEQVKVSEQFLKSEDNNWIEFKIDDIDIDKFIEYKDKGGIYYLQIKFNYDFNTLVRNSKSKIFDFLESEWKKDERKKIPNIIKKRKGKYDINELRSKNWIPFYIGKSKKFENRMEEHFNKDSSCETYGLKLNCVNDTFFSNCSYRIKFMDMPYLTQDEY
ncbi:MAG: hypothetical protein RR942_14445 [Romboutsia sp.]